MSHQQTTFFLFQINIKKAKSNQKIRSVKKPSKNQRYEATFREHIHIHRFSNKGDLQGKKKQKQIARFRLFPIFFLNLILFAHPEKMTCKDIGKMASATFTACTYLYTLAISLLYHKSPCFFSSLDSVSFFLFLLFPVSQLQFSSFFPSLIATISKIQAGKRLVCCL